jgi:hypothetical protein
LPIPIAVTLILFGAADRELGCKIRNSGEGNATEKIESVTGLLSTFYARVDELQDSSF